MANTRGVIEKGFNVLDWVFNWGFGRRNNPMFHLGALGFYFLWIVIVSGIYVYIFFDTSVTGAYSSVEQLTHDQWYFGGLMRSFHRYASDGLVVVMVLHMAREWARGRLKAARWFSWVTGVPVFWLVFIAGITGFWLVWDQLAQYIAVITSEWFDALPLAGSSIARNFLAPGNFSNRFFTLLIFVHIFAPLFLLLLLWVHVQRISKPTINPPRQMTAIISLALLVLSYLIPIYSTPAADLGVIPAKFDFDWYYLGLYPLFDGLQGGYVWAMGGLATLILLVLPVLPPGKRPKPAIVNLNYCNGCRRCLADCPYNAITMVRRSDGKPFEEEAVVNEKLCVSCGICVGACPASTPFRKTDNLVTGIDLPDPSLQGLRQRTIEVCKNLKGKNRKLIFTCERARKGQMRDRPQIRVVMPCIGMLPPSFIDFVISRGLADEVFLVGCEEGDCFHRFGIDWMNERIDQKRDPYLRARVPREKIHRLWDES